MSSPWAWVINEHKPLMLSRDNEGIPGDRHSSALRILENHSLMIAPLMLEGKLLGALTVISSTTVFTDQEMYLLISFANTATAAIHNAQLHSAVQYLAVTDPLTGIYNRRGFFDLATSKSISRCKATARLPRS